MKKIYTTMLSALTLSVFAQTRQTMPTGTASFKKPTAESSTPASVTPVTTPSHPLGDYYGKADGARNFRIGTTKAINQSNGSVYRRVHVLPGNKISVTWTTSTDGPATNNLSRGSGYNHYDGSAWGTISGLRIEPYRTGFPSLALSPDNKEIIFSHRIDTNGKSGGLVFNQNQSIGSTTWTSNIVFAPANPNIPSQLWPHVAISGDYMIVLANYTDSSAQQNSYIWKNGVRSPMVYSRYKFSNSTWTEQDLTLPGYDSTIVNETGGDIYSIDANGSNVAVLAGGQYNSLVLWKSINNGGSWTKTILDTFPKFPYRFDKDSLDETLGNNGSVHVLVDNNGMTHVFSGLCQIKDSIMNDKSITYTFARRIGGINDAIIYWNEYAGGDLRIIATSIAASNGDSVIADESYTLDTRSTGISNSTWPSAGIDAQGRIFLSYSAMIPLDQTAEGANYRDILVSLSADSGQTWSTPVNVTQFISPARQEMYPSIARTVDSKLYFTYLREEFPGIVAENDELYDINCLTIPVDMILNPGRVGINETDKLITAGDLYPNPTNGLATIPVDLKSAADITLQVQNILGQTVYTKHTGLLAAGQQQLSFETAGLEEGIYIYILTAGDVSATGKMVVKK
jgi:hypothetical protein